MFCVFMCVLWCLCVCVCVCVCVRVCVCALAHLRPLRFVWLCDCVFLVFVALSACVLVRFDGIRKDLEAFGSIREEFGSICQHVGASGCIRKHLKSCVSTWMNSKAYWTIWNHWGAFGVCESIRGHLEASASICEHVNACSWIHLEAFGGVWWYLRVF